MPMVDESIVTDFDFSSTRWMPWWVGYFPWPMLAGITFTTWPLSVTVIWKVAASTVLMWAGPILKWMVRWSAPQASLNLRPWRSLLTVTSVPGCQYTAGRQWTRAGLIHRQSPSTGGLV